MAKISVNPTRIELLKLKNRLKIAKHGYKILKDKQNGLMKEFMKIIVDSKKLRKEVETNFKEILEKFLFVAAEMLPQEMEESLIASEKKIKIEARIKNIMGVNIPEFNVEKEGDFLCYSLFSTSGELDSVLQSLAEILDKLIKLAQFEYSARLLAFEIEKTRRRVNALEYIFIPNIQESIKYIENKLAERERDVLISLMKIKEKIG